MSKLAIVPIAVPARDSAGNPRILFFPDPAPLPDWPNGDQDVFSRIFFIRIIDSNPKAFNIHVKWAPISPIKQSDLEQEHVDMALNADFLYADLDLNLKFNSGEDALVIFEMADPQAEFLEVMTPSGDTAYGIVQPGRASAVIHQARWIAGAGQKAVGVIMKGTSKRNPIEQEYGLGVKMTNNARGTTDINIDPKIGNDGED